MPSKTPLRRRISPSIPFVLHVEDETGASAIALKVSYDLNAFTAFEEVTGLSMLTEIGQVFDEPSVKTVTALLWAGVLENQPEYAGKEGLEVIRSLVTFPQLSDVLQVCTKAFLTQLPREKREALEKRLEQIKAGLEPDPLISAQATETAKAQ